MGGLTNQGILFENAVRGYPTNFRTGDSCAAASVEVRRNLVDGGGWGQLQLYPFLDFGTVWNDADPPPEPDTLFSMGVGLRWQWQEALLLEVNYGIALTEDGGESDSWQEQGLHLRFKLGTSF